MNRVFGKNKRVDLVFFALYPIIAALLSIAVKANLLLCGLIFFAVPSVYLSMKMKTKIFKAIEFASIIAIFLAIVVDYMGHLDNSWYIPSTSFSFRIFGLIALEDPIWIFLVAYELILLYEYFFNPKTTFSFKNKRIYIMFGGAILIFGIFLYLRSFIEDILYIPYFYLIWGISTLLLPCIIFLYFHPKLIVRFLILSTYAFYVALLSELVALHLDYWRFPGHNFIGWVTILGLTFPIEEFVLFLMFIPPAFLTYYEFFDDDGK